MKGFLYNLPGSIQRSYQGKHLFIQALAILSTYIVVTTGIDWNYLLSTRGGMLQSFLFPAVILGFLVPLVVPIILYIYALVTRKAAAKIAAFASGQAVILALTISTLYKIFTGRPGPHFGAGIASDTSHIFRFGILRGGSFQGWPSSHTAVAFAMSFALIYLYPKNKLLAITLFVYALYIGIGVSVSIHWLSDAIAGALIGSVIGISVARNFLATSSACHEI